MNRALGFHNSDHLLFAVLTCYAYIYIYICICGQYTYACFMCKHRREKTAILVTFHVMCNDTSEGIVIRFLEIDKTVCMDDMIEEHFDPSFALGVEELTFGFVR